MGRTREFDATEALDAALEVFWTKGYEATSVQDLASATLVNRASLNQTFGGKREEGMAQPVALKRFGRADEVAKAVLFLAADDASYVVGTGLFSDGGLAEL